MRAIDTNVLVRLLTRDDAKQVAAIVGRLKL
jgi:predicted nucleic-acid-binding protein